MTTDVISESQSLRNQYTLPEQSIVNIYGRNKVLILFQIPLTILRLGIAVVSFIVFTRGRFMIILFPAIIHVLPPVMTGKE